jgi:putrescine transport system ATP-binding protein
MDHGLIKQVATPAQIYEAPNSVYVADFIGDVNIIEGRATRADDEHYSIAWAEGLPPLTAACQIDLTPDAAVHYAIRPEKINVTADKPKDRTNAVRGKVVDIGYLGNISTYHVRLTTGQMMKAQIANTQRIDRRNFSWEDEVWLSWRDTAGIVLTE